MATTPVFVKAPSGLAGLVLKLAAEPIVGTLDPALVNGAGGDTLTELTNVLGWYSADVTEALAGSYVGTVETSGGTPIAADLFEMLDTTTPVFESSLLSRLKFTKANELDVNVQSINGAAVVGDGNATPWDGA